MLNSKLALCLVVTLGVCLMFFVAGAQEVGTIPAAQIVRVEAEDFPEVKGAAKVEFQVETDGGIALSPAPFGGTLMEFTASDGLLSGTLFLAKGKYQVKCYMNGPRGDADAVYIIVDQVRQRLWSHGFSNRNGQIPSFEVTIAEDGVYDVKVECAEVGAQVDALEFVRVE